MTKQEDAGKWRHMWMRLRGEVTAVEEMVEELFPDPDKPGSHDDYRAMVDLLAALSALTAEWEPA